MLTLEGLIAVISLVLTAFGLGYAIGNNNKTALLYSHTIAHLLIRFNVYSTARFVVLM